MVWFRLLAFRKPEPTVIRTMTASREAVDSGHERRARCPRLWTARAT
jgi:hypothetical protein